MPIYIQDNQATASLRRVPMIVFADTAGTPWAGSVTGVKVRLSVNGGAETDTAADIVRVAGAAHYAQLSQSEVNVNPGDIIYLRLPAAAGRQEAFATVEIGADDPTAAAATPASVAAAVWDATTRELTGIGASIREAFADTFLNRNVAGGSNGGRSVSLFFFKGVNRWLRRGTNNATLDIYGTNDTTVVATETLTLDANGTVIGSDPA
jgi:hypothetical protein